MESFHFSKGARYKTTNQSIITMKFYKENSLTYFVKQETHLNVTMTIRADCMLKLKTKHGVIGVGSLTIQRLSLGKGGTKREQCSSENTHKLSHLIKNTSNKLDF